VTVRRGSRRSRLLHGGGSGGSTDVVPCVIEPAFHPVYPRRHAALVLFGTGQQDPRAQKLKMQPRGSGAGHLGQGRVGDVCGAGQFRGTKVMRLVLQPRDLIGGHPAKDGLRAFGHGLHDDEVAEALQEVLDEPARIVAGLDHPVYCTENGSCI
jgi:hypothetical protein